MPPSLYIGQCITVIGTVSLQQYIFRSNRLKENIGASYLVKHWLDQGLIDTLRDAGYTVETSTWEAYKAGGTPSAAAGVTADAEVIYIGGGNAALLFKTRARARQAIWAWSKKVLEEASGLRIAVGYGEVEHSLATAYKQALQDLEACENGLPFGTSLLALPIVRTCTSTSLPAVTPSEEEAGEWISREAASKRKQVGPEHRPSPAQQTIAQHFRALLTAPKRFAVQLDELGGREGEAHIAVVHADGNDVGWYLNTVVDQDTGDDTAFLRHVREFSASVAQLASTALQQTLKRLQSASLDSLIIPEDIFPIRPIVYGGDDLTFVCDGRLGLELAAAYLQEFAQGTIMVAGTSKAIDACAGVAIVPTKFPFARAYAFADELCTLAKKQRRACHEGGGWLDFHIIHEGATGSIEELRQHQYRALTGHQLHQRPYKVPDTWATFVATLQGFRTWPRSRAKGLMQALVQGPGMTQHFVAGARWRHYTLPNPTGMDANAPREGWTGGGAQSTTPYFDPLEALDFYLDDIPFPLEAARAARPIERMAP